MSDACYHCGEPAEASFTASIAGEQKAFCCIGCQAVTRAIVEGGLGDFYKYREAPGRKPEDDIERFDAYDLPEVYSEFTSKMPDGTKRVKLLVGGISCAACAWLIEHELEKLAGVEHVRVNVATHICQFHWHADTVKLSEVFSALHAIGYKPQPGLEGEAQVLRKREFRNAIVRIGIAGLGMMQVGMVGVALHAGALQGMENSWQHYLRWVSLLFALPVMLFSALPFYKSALRGLRSRYLNMDVPVSLALILAFCASVFGTVTNEGEVYFDSVSMFTFFLLVGRFLEMRARHSSIEQTETLSRLLPSAVNRIASNNELELVPIRQVRPGDLIRVSAGDVVPCDGVLEGVKGAVDESMLTGESQSVEKREGDQVYAGSILAEPAIVIRVNAVGENTRLSAVQALLDDALASKPKQQKMADKVAAYFVTAVLVCFACTFLVWWQIDHTRAFWVALSVLVVTCPCALSLATPTALASGLSSLSKRGFLVLSQHAMERLPAINHLVFDKTGTLTTGSPEIREVITLADVDKAQVLSIAAALEAFSRHPIAKAFEGIKTQLRAEDIHVVAGKGIQGKINGETFGFGRADFLMAERQPRYPGPGSWQLLTRANEALAWVELVDAPRPELRDTLLAFQKRGLKLSLLSGDRQTNVNAFLSDQLSGVPFSESLGDLLPEQKLAQLKRMQSRNDTVLMVGDGINDIPVLGAADVSVAMGNASRLAQINADTVLLSQRLSSIDEALVKSSFVKRITQQNFAWAIGYNLLALPAAMLGWVPPYLAALGMSLSSVIVVSNSLRAQKHTVQAPNA